MGTTEIVEMIESVGRRYRHDFTPEEVGLVIKITDAKSNGDDFPMVLENELVGQIARDEINLRGRMNYEFNHTDNA